MRSLFNPAITLMNHLSYSRKFILLGLLFLISIAILTNSLVTSLNEIIRTSQKQLTSISLVEPISHTVHDIQLHRGVSAALLNGNEAMQDRRAAMEKQEVESFNALEEKLPDNLKASEEWYNIKASWETLRKENPNWTISESYDAHTHLIELLLHFELALTQNSEVDTLYLVNIATNRLPEVLEHLGQIRALSIGILAEKQITEAQKRKMHGLIANFDDAFVFLKLDFAAATRQTPALQGILPTISMNISDSAQQIIDLVELDILTGRLITSPEHFLMTATTKIDNAYSQLYESLLPLTITLIKARITRAENALYTSISVAFLLFLVVVYFSMGSYYATTGSIWSLARSARRFAGGDMNERINLNTHDEIRQVGNSFNEMADGFNAVLIKQKQVEQVLKESEDKFRSIYEGSNDAIMLWTEKGFSDCNMTTLKMFGLTSKDDLIGLNPSDFSPPLQPDGQDSFTATNENIAMAFEQGLNHFEWIHRRRGGEEFPAEVTLSTFNLQGEKVLLATVRDISKRKLNQEKMLRLAYYDTLTGLPNRTLFYDRLTQEIKKVRRSGLKIALLAIDLDKFKEVNDSLGHSMGDILLVEAARRISSCVRESDTEARLGGDEFFIILPELGDTSSIERIVENILQKLTEPFHLGDETAYISGSIGISLYPDDAAGVEELVKSADQALYVSKNKGRNGYSYFTPELEQAAQTRLHRLKDLRSALEDGHQFQVYYQPVVDLATGRINKAEALIRWQHPEHGMLSPDQFIPLAEDSGLIIEIGNRVFRQVAQQVKQWRAQYNPEFQISVNKSPKQFLKSSSIDEVWLNYLRELGLPGSSVAIEITEGLLLDVGAEVTERLLEFRNAGVQVAIDDFGTGYSSLSYLKKFDIDYLKIDRMFISNLETDTNDMALSKAIIVMAHELGLKVIAEGVETFAQCRILADAGCDYGQGYLFSKPASAEEFETLLKYGTADKYTT